MKKSYTLALMFICINLSYAQERFFTFIDGWQAVAIAENDSSYTIIGNASTFVPEFLKYVQFTRLDKLGNQLSAWTYLPDSTVATEMRNQQSFITYNGIPLMGMTVVTEWEEPFVSKRFQLSSDLGQIIDNTWQYIPNQNGAIMYGTLQTESDKILHSVQTFNDTIVRSRLLQTDTLGNIEWESIFSCNVGCRMKPHQIIPAHDGGYLFTNEEERIPIVGDHEVGTIIKVDSLGVQQWRIYPGGVGLPYASEHILAIPTDDGNYLCAWTDNFMRIGAGIPYQLNPDATIWFAKIAPNGAKLWEKNIQPAIELWDIDESATFLKQIIKLSDGNIALTSFDKIIKITQDADVIWARRVIPDSFITSDPYDPELTLLGIKETSDGGLICAGEAWVYPGDIFPEFTQIAFVTKVDEYGCLEPDCHLDDPVSLKNPKPDIAQMLLFPNPANEYITLQYDILQSYQQLSLSITDLTGSQVYSKQLVQSEYQLVISTNQFPAGQYFCNLKADGQMVSRKFVVVK